MEWLAIWTALVAALAVYSADIALELSQARAGQVILAVGMALMPATVLLAPFVLADVLLR